MAAPPSAYRRKSGRRITPYLCVRGIKSDGSATEADKLRREKRAGRVLDNGKRREKSPPRNRGENSLAKLNAASQEDDRQAAPKG